MTEALGVADAAAAIKDEATRAILQHNFDRALADDVYGVPSFVCDGELFWGEDATEMFADYLKDREMFKTDAISS